MNNVWLLQMVIAVIALSSSFGGCWDANNIIETSNGSIRIYHTSRGLDPLARTFVPSGATNIRLHYDSGFGGQSYSASCHVSMKDLNAFARKEEYSFVSRAYDDNGPWTRLLCLHRDGDPVLCDAPEVQDGLPVNHHFDGYMVSEKEHDGRHYEFLYDKKCEILYVHYFD